MQAGMPVETALRVYRRYLKLEPSHTEEYIAYLKSKVAIAYFKPRVVIAYLNSREGIAAMLVFSHCCSCQA